MASPRDIYFSFFMFTADLQPDNPDYTKVIVSHIKALTEMGYTGFDLPIAPGNSTDHRAELESYRTLRKALDNAGVGDVGFTTNVAATAAFNPSSTNSAQREIGLNYLKSRVDISKALRASAMAGPIVLPYGVFPVTNDNQPIWSDALQDWMSARYSLAQPVLAELADYAVAQGVKVAIEPVDHWETPGPNLATEVVDFLDGIGNPQIGACIDSAHVTLGSDGVSAFVDAMARLSAAKRLHYVHISAPDRGAIHDSWIPWKPFLRATREQYEGPYLVEVFNAIPVFLGGLRLTRRRFWRNGEDAPEDGRPSAYVIAQKAIETLRREMAETGRT